MPAGFGQMVSNYASNAIASTVDWLKVGATGYKKAFSAGRFGLRQADRWGLEGAAKGQFAGDIAGNRMADFFDSQKFFKNRGAGYVGSSMATIGVGGGIGVAGAADFMNPWGLGWGD